jgi:predicted component of type VI protein secretion system
MEHVVFYPSADGSPAFRRVPSLEDAVTFVEHLRNSDGVTECSVHALAEVPLSFRAYYHVEVPGIGAAADPAPVTAAEPEVNEAPAPTAEGPTAEVPAEAVAEAPAAQDVAGPAVPEQVNTPFATAPPVAASVPPSVAAAAEVDAPPAEAADDPLGDSAEVVPVPGGRRSMGFFARS